MDIYDFAVYYPQLYQRIDDEVQNVIAAYQMNGQEPLHDLDRHVENIVNKYGSHELFREDTVAKQQFRGGDRDWDRGRDRDWDRGRDRDRDRDGHRRRREFNLRDLTRILFFRRLFDRDRRW